MKIIRGGRSNFPTAVDEAPLTERSLAAGLLAVQSWLLGTAVSLTQLVITTFLNLTAQSATPTAPTSGVDLFGQKVAGRTLSRAISEIGAARYVQSAAWEKSKESAMEKYPDWEEVAMSDKVSISPAMAVAMMEVNRVKGNAGEIAYYLGKNPAEAERIAKLEANEDILIEISELSAKLKLAPVERKVSQAPKPPKPITGSRETVERADEELPMEEYAAKRQAQLRSHTN